jgi:hypothetical protein
MSWHLDCGRWRLQALSQWGGATALDYASFLFPKELMTLGNSEMLLLKQKAKVALGAKHHVPKRTA